MKIKEKKRKRNSNIQHDFCNNLYREVDSQVTSWDHNNQTQKMTHCYTATSGQDHIMTWEKVELSKCGNKRFSEICCGKFQHYKQRFGVRLQDQPSMRILSRSGSGIIVLSPMWQPASACRNSVSDVSSAGRGGHVNKLYPKLSKKKH